MFEALTGGNAQKLEVGETVEGLVFHIDRDQGQEKNSTVYHIRQKDGSVKKIWGAAIIDNSLSEAKLDVPYVVRIAFDGKGKTSTGKPLNLYTVEVDRDADHSEYPDEESIAEAKDATNPLMDEPMPEEV